MGIYMFDMGFVILFCISVHVDFVENCLSYMAEQSVVEPKIGMMFASVDDEGHREEDKRVLGNHRWEVRTGSLAKINVGLNKETGNYVVKALEMSHNHDLEPPETTHMLRSYRKMSEAQAFAIMFANDSGLKPKATYELTSREAGGRLNVGYVMEDQKTYLRSIKKMMHGELGSIMRIMTVDYIAFGDVVVFDTTYGSNKELRPVAVFTGSNHHRGMVIFGAALHMGARSLGQSLQIKILQWQNGWLVCGEKHIMDYAHGIMQNGIKHLGYRMKDDGSMLLKDFKKCMFEYLDEVEFEMQWKMMLQAHGLEDDNWLKRTYDLKRKWAKLDDKRYKELEAEFKARQKIPPLGFYDSPLLHQALKRYTPAIFTIFQKELSLSMRVMIKNQAKCENKDEYVVGVYGVMNKEFKVPFDPNDKSISCSFMKFESMGVLCCHASKILIRLYIMKISESYIINRWTREVKTSYILNEWRPTIREDNTQWVKRIQSQLLRMTYQASLNDDTRACMERVIEE
ncbi:protein FAR1-RELATED SEQUENCE 5-like [Tripterygium wilfordii]|uniref:protein FAR1-RELATED SEQUENCE 5-like n=1 Tax=Tripterygium wilfordii TaxID=458696 RepID=UPI0018F82555|nr:protein FAR1-RELATED SEQUENCE 5-like [Tripterygium wilfordii]